MLDTIDLIGLDFYESFDLVNKNKIPYKSKPSKPRMNSNPTLDSVDDFRRRLVIYNERMEEHDKYMEKQIKINSFLSEKLEDKMKEEAGLYDIPEQYQGKVYRVAYDMGHSSGYAEVYNYLMTLVGIF